MTTVSQYSAMGKDQARAFTDAVATKAYRGARWKSHAAREFGMAKSTVYSWFRDDGRPPFWFLAACETRSELDLLRAYLIRGIPKA